MQADTTSSLSNTTEKRATDRVNKHTGLTHDTPTNKPAEKDVAWDFHDCGREIENVVVLSVN